MTLPGLGDTYLDNEFLPSIREFIRLTSDEGVQLNFNSAYRTPLKQTRTNSGNNPKATNSLHSCGFAVDVDYAVLPKKTRQIIRGAAAKAGLEWGGSFNDPPHFYIDPQGARSNLIKKALEEYNQLRRESRSICEKCEY